MKVRLPRVTRNLVVAAVGMGLWLGWLLAEAAAHPDLVKVALLGTALLLALSTLLRRVITSPRGRTLVGALTYAIAYAGGADFSMHLLGQQPGILWMLALIAACLLSWLFWSGKGGHTLWGWLKWVFS